MIEGPHSEGWNRGRYGNKNSIPNATTCNREGYHRGACMYLPTLGDGEKGSLKGNKTINEGNLFINPRAPARDQ